MPPTIRSICRSIDWTERVQILQYESLFQTQAATLERRLVKAEAAVRGLTGRTTWFAPPRHPMLFCRSKFLAFGRFVPQLGEGFENGQGRRRSLQGVS